MKNGIPIKIEWDYFGALLANESSEEQVKFFKAFAREVDAWGTHFQKESQMMQISKELSEKEKEILSGISYKK